MKKYFAILLAFFSITANAQTSLADLQFKDLNNQPVSLEKYKGKNVYMKVWASWCPFCLAGLPDMDTLSAEKGKNFEVVTVVSPIHRGEKTTEEFIRWYKGLDYKNITVLLDEQGEVLKRARIRGYPSSVILNKDLNIKKSQAGHFSNEQIKREFE